MSMEWFNRVTSELQEQLESICEEYDKSGHMSINQASKHPRIEFFVETDMMKENISLLFFSILIMKNFTKKVLIQYSNNQLELF